MFQYLRGIAFIAAIMLNCRVASAEDVTSANYLMPGCRAVLLDPTPPQHVFEAGYCLGVVVGLKYSGRNVCPPKRATNQQVLRVVLKYIDDRPQRQNENFMDLALEALRAAWPCKN
jgi:Rap1a immunity proteins